MNSQVPLEATLVQAVSAHLIRENGDGQSGTVYEATPIYEPTQTREEDSESDLSQEDNVEIANEKLSWWKRHRKVIAATSLVSILVVVGVLSAMGAQGKLGGAESSAESGVLSTSPEDSISIPSENSVSVSLVPTSSSSPTVSHHPTPAPSISSSPTQTCHWIAITVEYDDDPHETSWLLERAGRGSANVLVKSLANAAIGDTSHTESICLEEGEYEFTIQDVAGDGMCCGVTQGYGNYNITSNGSLTAEGGEFGRSESTTFTIPISPAPSAVPSMVPTSSIIPTISPTRPPTMSPSHQPSMPPTTIARHLHRLGHQLLPKHLHHLHYIISRLLFFMMIIRGKHLGSYKE